MKTLYRITNNITGKVYIGVTGDAVKRFSCHKTRMRAKTMHPSYNPMLYEDGQKYGADAFVYEVMGQVEDSVAFDEEAKLIKAHSAHIDGYNRCSGTRGDDNPNFGNKWSDTQKSKMSEIAIKRHNSGKFYNEEWKKKIGEASAEMWKDKDKRERMAEKVKLKKRQYRFQQFSRDGEFIREWDSVEDIVAANPEYKWQNIYSVCNGYKNTYRGFVWKKIPKTI